MYPNIFNFCFCWCKSLVIAFLLGSHNVLIHSGINIPFIVLTTTSHMIMFTVHQDANTSYALLTNKTVLHLSEKASQALL